MIRKGDSKDANDSKGDGAGNTETGRAEIALPT